MDKQAFLRLYRRVQRLYSMPDDGAFTAAMDTAAAECTDEQWREIEALSSPRHNVEQPTEQAATVVDDNTTDATIFDCPHQDAVMWNPFNHCVQCHRCGTIFGPWDYKTPLPESVRPDAPQVE